MELYKRDIIGSFPKSEYITDNARQGDETFNDSTDEHIRMINSPDNNDLLSQDESRIIQALKLIIKTLDTCQNIKIFNDDVIIKILNLGNSKNHDIITYVIDIISWITILDDEDLKRYLFLQPSFKQVLLNIISVTRNPEIIIDALNALYEILNDKFDTIKLIDGEDLYNASIFVLSQIHQTKNKKKLQMCCPALNLLTRCMCFFNASDELIEKSSNEILFFLNSSKFNNLKPFILSLICEISYYQSERSINSFSETMIQYINIIAQEKDIPPNNIENVFGSLNNMVYKSDEFAIFLPTCSPLFRIEFDQTWSEKSLFHYFRLQDNVFLRMILCDRNELNWKKSIENIRNNTDFIASNGMKYFDFFNFKTKKQFIEMICHLYQLDDSEILMRMKPYLKDLITLFVDHLDCNNLCLSFEIAKTLIFLYEKSSLNGESNEVLDILKETYIPDVIENVMKEGETDAEIQRVFTQIQRRCQNLSS